MEHPLLRLSDVRHCRCQASRAVYNLQHFLPRSQSTSLAPSLCASSLGIQQFASNILIPKDCPQHFRSAHAAAASRLPDADAGREGFGSDEVAEHAENGGAPLADAYAPAVRTRHEDEASYAESAPTGYPEGHEQLSEMGELYQDRSHSYDAGGDEPEAGEVERGRHVGEGAPGGDAAYHSRDAISMDDGQAQPLALCESRIMTAQSFDDGDGDDAMREPRHGFKDGQPKDDDGDRHAELDLRDGHGTRHRDGEYHGYNGDGSGDGGHGGEAYGHGEYEGTGGYAQGDGYDQGYGDDRHMGLGGQQRGDDGAGDIEVRTQWHAKSPKMHAAACRALSRCEPVARNLVE
eukprot:294090-Pleurochrysis_carterae.AAC.4